MTIGGDPKVVGYSKKDSRRIFALDIVEKIGVDVEYGEVVIRSVRTNNEGIFEARPIPSQDSLSLVAKFCKLLDVRRSRNRREVGRIVKY